jgi:serine/threonine protein kinase
MAAFALEGEMVAGGMGTVYRAVDLVSGEIVAVKISSSFGSQLGERFQQEATFLAEIAHPPSFATCPTVARQGASTISSWSGWMAKP